MDAATVLEQYVSDLTNLPAEMAHVLEEIGDKDVKFYETRKRIQQRDNQIHKFIKAHGSLADNPKEAQAYPKIRADFEKAMQLQQQKMDLSNTGLYIIAKQLKRLNDDIKKLENEGLLAPVDGTTDFEDSDAVKTTATTSRRATASVTASRNSPAVTVQAAATSRSTTPAARPTKRLKTAQGDVATSTAAVVSSPAAPANKANNPYSRQPQHVTQGEEEETLYCTCQQVSFGNMVACDNPDCQYEWFHYDCVGLTAPPSGTWYCPPCSKARKEKDFKDSSTTKRKRA